MKKKLCILMAIIICILPNLFGVLAHADIVDDDYKEFYYDDKKLYFHDNIEFNYICDRSSNEYYNLRYWYLYNVYDLELEGYFISGMQLEVYNNDGLMKKTSFEIHSNIYEGCVTSIDYVFDGELIYHFKIDDSNLDDDYYEFDGFDICEFYGEYVICKGLYVYYDESELEFLNPYASTYQLRGRDTDNILFLKYEIDAKDNEIVIDYENPLSLTDIVDSVGIKNKNDERIGNYDILASNYDENDVEIGLYNIKIRGIDTNGDIYIKTIYVDSKRIKNPIHISDVKTMYNEIIDENYLISKAVIDCEYSELTIESEYFNNSNICDEYQYSITIKTVEGQYFTSVANIIVLDTIQPIITGPDTIQTDTENVLSYDEILSRYVVNDEYDNSSLKVELKETNNEDSYYINNYNVSGIYKFRVLAYDKYNNCCVKDIKLYVNKVKPMEVIDNNTTTITISPTQTTTTPVVTTTNPVTTKQAETTNVISSVRPIIASNPFETTTVISKNEEFKLLTTTNNKLTLESIKNSLLDKDLIVNDQYDSVMIESDYFNNYDKVGIYDVLVTIDGGNSFNFNIEVKESVVVEEVKDNKKLSSKEIIMYSVIGGVIIIVIVIVIIIRRRKNDKKA